MEAESKPIKTEEKNIRYSAFIAIGITFIGAGIALGTASNPGLYGLAVLGIIFLILVWQTERSQLPLNEFRGL